MHRSTISGPNTVLFAPSPEAANDPKSYLNHHSSMETKKVVFVEKISEQQSLPVNLPQKTTEPQSLPVNLPQKSTEQQQPLPVYLPQKTTETLNRYPEPGQIQSADNLRLLEESKVFFPKEQSPNHLTVMSRRSSNHNVSNESVISPDPRHHQHHIYHQHHMEMSESSLNISKSISMSTIVLEPETNFSKPTTTTTTTTTTSCSQKTAPRASSISIIPKPENMNTLIDVPRRACSVNQILPNNQNPELSFDHAGVSLYRPINRGKHNFFQKQSTKVSTPLKMPKHINPQSTHKIQYYNGPVPAHFKSNHTGLLNKSVESQSINSSVEIKQVSQLTLSYDNDILSNDYNDGKNTKEEDEVFKLINDDDQETETSSDYSNSKTKSDFSIPIPETVPFTTNQRNIPTTSVKPPNPNKKVSISTQCTPSINKLYSEVDTNAHKQSAYSAAPYPTDVEFEVSDDSSVEDNYFNNFNKYPMSPYAVKERLEDSDELGLEDLLTSSYSKAIKFNTANTASKTLTPNTNSAFYIADRFDNTKNSKINNNNDNYSPESIHSGPRRVIASEYQDDSIDSFESIKMPSEKMGDDLSEDESTFAQNRTVSTESCNEMAEYNNDLEYNEMLDQSAVFTAATTLSIDSETFDNVLEVPRMVISKRRRSANDCNDVKEIVVSGCVGVETTIILTFVNQRHVKQVMVAKAVQMRFDAIGGNRNVSSVVKYPKSPTIFTPRADNSGTSAFEVYPRKFELDPNNESTLHVRFLPLSVGIYSGVLKVRSNKKSFVLLLRGEAFHESPSKAEPLNRSIAFENDDFKVESSFDNFKKLISPTKRCSDKIEKSLDEKTDKFCQYVSQNSQVSSSSNIDTTAVNDPLIMRQKWLRDWLSKASSNNHTFINAAYTDMPTTNKYKYLNYANNSSAISVIPSSLRLLPQRVDKVGKHGDSLISKSLLQGSILVRNFSEKQIDIKISTSDPSIMTRESQMSIAAHNAVSVVVEFDTKKQFSENHMRSPDQSQGKNVGYVMITASNGEEFVSDIKMPPKSCLSPFIEDELLANNSLKAFINADMSPITKNNFDSKFAEKNTYNHNMIESSPQDAALLQRKREKAAARNKQPEMHLTLKSDDLGRSHTRLLDESKTSNKIISNLSPKNSTTHMKNTSTSTRAVTTPKKVLSPMRLPKSNKKLPEFSPVNYVGSKFASNEDLVIERDIAVNNGVFFRKLMADFGTVSVGSLTRKKIELCNSTNEEVIYIYMYFI